MPKYLSHLFFKIENNGTWAIVVNPAIYNASYLTKCALAKIK